MNPLLIGPLLEVGKSLIDKLFPDKEKQAAERSQAEYQLAQLAQDGKFKELGIQMSAIIAEAQSPDPWTSRARPSFMYVIYLVILMGVPMGLLSAFRPEVATQVAAGFGAWLEAVPDSLWTLFGVGYLGYATTRTFEKVRGAAK